MMRHPDEGLLQAYLDSELVFDEARDVERHLLHCRECEDHVSALARAGTDVSAALAVLDPDPGSLPEPGAVLWEIRGRRARERSGRHQRRAAVAAGLALVLGAGAAMAFPGSPLRDWLQGEPEPPVAVTMAQPEEVSLSLALVDGSARVELPVAPAGLRVLARSGASGPLTVAAPSGARFEHGAGWIRIHDAASDGVLRLTLPAGARAIELRIGGTAHRLTPQAEGLRLDGALQAAPDAAEPGGTAQWIDLTRALGLSGPEGAR
jgi:hypothetical protein